MRSNNNAVFLVAVEATASYVHDYSGNGKPGLTYGEGSCSVERACGLCGYNFLGMRAGGPCVIGKHSCTAKGSCNSGDYYRIGNGSCGGEFSCQQGEHLHIGDTSCIGEESCADGSTVTVGNNSCHGKQSCFEGFQSDIGNGSCNGLRSCRKVNPFSLTTIGNGSCNGNGACDHANKVGNNACNGDKACILCPNYIKDNQCNKDNPSDFNKKNGNCIYCEDEPQASLTGPFSSSSIVAGSLNNKKHTFMSVAMMMIASIAIAVLVVARAHRKQQQHRHEYYDIIVE